MQGIVTDWGRGLYLGSGTEEHIYVTRKDYRPDGTKTACLYSHSLGATARAAYDPTLARDALATIAEAGIPCLSTDLGGTTTWGNDTSVSRLGSAAYYAQTVLGAKGGGSGKSLIYAPSMGALAALNFARAYPASVAAIALVCPVVDLAYQHDQNVQGYAASIETAYGGASGYAAEVAGNDPMQNAAAIAALGIPMKMWRSSNDVVAPTARQDAFATAANIPVVNLGAIGHTLTNVPWSDVASFLANYA